MSPTRSVRTIVRLSALFVVAALASGCVGSDDGGSDVDVTVEASQEVSGPANSDESPSSAEATVVPDEPSDGGRGSTEDGVVENEIEFGSAAWDLLGTYDLENVPIRRVYVLVDPDLGSDEIVAIVDALRADAETDDVEAVEHYLMDDDSMFDALLRELAKSEQGDSSGWPIDYVVDHTVATSKLYFVPDGDGGADRRYWVCAGVESCDEDETLAQYDA